MLFYFSTPYLLEYTIQQTNFSWHTPLWAEIYYVAEKIIGHPPTPAYMPHTKQRAPPLGRVVMPQQCTLMTKTRESY